MILSCGNEIAGKLQYVISKANTKTLPNTSEDKILLSIEVKTKFTGKLCRPRVKCPV